MQRKKSSGRRKREIVIGKRPHRRSFARSFVRSSSEREWGGGEEDFFLVHILPFLAYFFFHPNPMNCKRALYI